MSTRPWTSTATFTHALVGLEVDNLLAFLALMGLLRAIEEVEPGWSPRASWEGPPWRARLHLGIETSTRSIAEVACRGIERIAAEYEFGDRKNVAFERGEFRAYAEEMRPKPVGAALVAALTAEHPEKKGGGGLLAAPLVMMFGQGHQNFLERLREVPRSGSGDSGRQPKKLPDGHGIAKVEAALFAPWTRSDKTDGFRWDPEDDQRYALRYGNPGKEGAAPTVHGANRLAAIGLLSFACVPGSRFMARGAGRDEDGVYFAWPVWTQPLRRSSIERLLSHVDVINGRVDGLAPLGVAEIYRARRVANGKFMNVSRAMPVRTIPSPSAASRNTPA